jgi:hypothetical protein
LAQVKQYEGLLHLPPWSYQLWLCATFLPHVDPSPWPQHPSVSWIFFFSPPC